MDENEYTIGKIEFSYNNLVVDNMSYLPPDDSIITQTERSKEHEYLLILAEESSEITQAATKIIRFGMENVHNGETNKERLKQEIADLLVMVDLLNIDINDLEEQKKNKRKKLIKYGVINEKTF